LIEPSKAGPADDEAAIEGGSNAKSGVDESSDPVLPGMVWLLLLLLAGEEDGGQIAALLGRKRAADGEVVHDGSRWVVVINEAVVEADEGRDDIVDDGRGARWARDVYSAV
jgi:hypothetical protein